MDILFRSFLRKYSDNHIDVECVSSAFFLLIEILIRVFKFNLFKIYLIIIIIIIDLFRTQRSNGTI